MPESCLYVIELESDKDPEAKWYVGISKNPEKRYQQHKCGSGAEWTHRNTIVEHYKISWHPERYIRKLEHHLTAELMDAYGKNSTRGAKYLSPILYTTPRTKTDAMPPAMVDGLRETGNEELARIATKPRFYIKIEESFRNSKEASEWAKEHLADGVTVELSMPIEPVKASHTMDEHGDSDS